MTSHQRLTSRVRTLSVSLWLLSACGLALAQDPDQVGIYFDDTYSQTTVEVTSFPQVVTGYLVMHNPSATDGVSGWEGCLGL